MKEKVKIESGMRAEIHTADGKVHFIEEPEVVHWEGVLGEDWEARKWEAAVAAMQALLIRGECSAEQVAEFSFKYADALVKKFKEEEK